MSGFGNQSLSGFGSQSSVKMTEEIRKINIKDKEYPAILKKIAEAPEALFVRGEIFAKEKCFAIVGTRRCTAYGREIAKEIAQDLAQAGLTIVSGFAAGIDTAAHWGAVEISKRTIAVLGTGLDEKSIYPRANLKLGQKILKTEGALISEYPPGTSGSKFTFPQRNRIISGLSLGVLVVEAPGKSGALITANWAKQQERKIFAVPGSVHSINSKGPHLLIKQGAKLVETANDILAELKLPKTAKKRGQTPLSENEEEKLILKVLKEGALPIDKIIEKSGLNPGLAISTLTIMESKAIVKNLGGNTYILS